MAKASLIFSITDKVGGLFEALNIVKSHNLNMSRIESRPSKTSAWDYDFFIDFTDPDAEHLKRELDVLVQELKSKGYGSVIASGAKRNLELSQTSSAPATVAWFPRKIADLDEFAHKTLDCGSELSADHPGFTDTVYRERRKQIVELGKTFKHGQKIPTVQYTADEIKTWGVVYRELTKLFPTHACRQLNYVFPLLEQNCGYGPDNIPQLEDISSFLQDITGWRLRPVQGLLSARDFLNGLAFRVFHSTQYIRHASKPFYTPEPDVCHELLGHVPLFADPDFADFSQEIGLASLGATDDDIEKLATCYWFTVEYGLCKEDGQIKAYGAGLLSSFGELKYCLGGDDKKPKYLDFDPFDAAVRKYPITEYQPAYYVAESFTHAKEKLKEFAHSLSRPFEVRYNAITQSVEILDSTSKIAKFAKEIRAEMASLQSALIKMSSQS